MKPREAAEATSSGECPHYLTVWVEVPEHRPAGSTRQLRPRYRPELVRCTSSHKKTRTHRAGMGPTWR